MAAAEAAVVRAGHAILDMAYFTARDVEPADSCARMVAKADVFVGIIGLRFGAAVRGQPEISYTELEFELATHLGLPRLVFLVREGAEPTAPANQAPDDARRQAAFRDRLLEAGLTTAWVGSPAELEIVLHQSLVQLEAHVMPSHVMPAELARSPAVSGLLHTEADAPSPMVAFWARLDQPEIGRAILLLRRYGGLTREKLVQRIWDVSGEANPGVDISLVYRWERGEKNRPPPRPGTRYRRLLALVCEGELQAMSPIDRREFLHQLALLAGPALLAGTFSPGQWLVSAALRGGVRPDRQHFDLVRQGLDDAITSSSEHAAIITDWEETVLAHGRATRDRPSPLMLQDLGRDLTELKRAFGTSRSPDTARELTRVAAQMAGLMCLTLVKLDDRDAFRQWARTGRIAAAQAGDPLVHSWVRAQEAYGHYYAGDLRRAIEVAQDAQRLGASNACVGAVLAAALEARAHAALGRVADTRDAVHRAESILSRLDPQHLVPSAFGYSEAQLRFHESNALTQLGDTKRAWVAQERALALTPEYDYTDRALTHLDRATCMIQVKDFAGAAEYASRALASLTAEQRRGIIVVRARAILAALPATVHRGRATRDLRELVMNAEGDT